MANISDDEDDAYLYGSDDESAKVPNVKKESNVKLEGDDIEIDEVEQSKDQKDIVAEEDEEEEDDDVEDDSDEDSEDDIDIIIGEEKPSTALASTNNDTVDALVDIDGEQSKSTTTTIVANNQGESKSAIDINAIGEYEGKPITQLDLETLKEKPWRAPGVDISDYFNYGFNEFSWIAYCFKQDKTRGEFKPETIMAQMMASGNPPLPTGAPMPPGMNMNMPPGMPNMPPGMPPMGMMPQGFMPGMPMGNFPNMPNMPPGMPNMPPGMPSMPPGMNMNMPQGMPMPPNFQPPPNGKPIAQYQNFNGGPPPPPPPPQR
ncbi:Fip1 motif-domain-containing protein [Scheffersomyces coipomensis]|uniref:Fip1 motif-domain-containing protein n=1 Tax=Scheffersomyces coipomensis TaxID=1788519 RepID=UPI00315D2F99